MWLASKQAWSTYLSNLVWECWVQLNSILHADHITFNNRYMKCAHTRQRMTNNNNDYLEKNDNASLLSTQHPLP